MKDLCEELSEAREKKEKDKDFHFRYYNSESKLEYLNMANLKKITVKLLNV
jgi:hypothetical protein